MLTHDEKDSDVIMTYGRNIERTMLCVVERQCFVDKFVTVGSEQRTRKRFSSDGTAESIRGKCNSVTSRMTFFNVSCD